MSNSKEVITKVSSCLLRECHVLSGKNDPVSYPNIDKIVVLIKNIRMALFPGYFNESIGSKPVDSWLESLLGDIFDDMSGEIKTALYKNSGSSNNLKEAALQAEEITKEFLADLPQLQELLYKDAEAGFNGDPAAKGEDEVILTYPGFLAVFIYRVAHFLFEKSVPYIPRMMSEYSHRMTGIDIHPGAKIGAYFFIDHGTGVVIGETTVIGNYVKLYQGVTLGALSTRKGQQLAGKKRHPTLEDNVTIYSGASILGGETVISSNITINGNAFITESVKEDNKAK